jgi:hypothetical protein
MASTLPLLVGFEKAFPGAALFSKSVAESSRDLAKAVYNFFALRPSPSRIPNCPSKGEARHAYVEKYADFD